MGNAVFGVCQLRDPLTDFQKNGTVHYVGDPPHMQVLGSVGSKGACLRMREIITHRRLFFLFFALTLALLLFTNFLRIFLSFSDALLDSCRGSFCTYLDVLCAVFAVTVN